MYLNQDYSTDGDAFCFYDPITLDFQNHTITMNAPSYLFQILGDNVTIQNLVLVNAGTSTIYNYANSNNFRMINVTFKGISMITEDWAVFGSEGSNFEMINITFQDICLKNRCNLISSSGSNFSMTNVNLTIANL